MPGRLALALGAALLLGSAAEARADEVDDLLELGALRRPPTARQRAQGRRHYRTAARFYEEGSYEAAYVEMATAYRLSRMPDLLYNLSRVADRLGRSQDALRFLERYLAARPGAQDAEKVKEDIERLRVQLAPPPPPPPEPAIAAPPPRPVAPAIVAAKASPPPAPPPYAAIGLLCGGVALVAVGAGLGGGAMASAADVERQGRQAPGQPFSSSLYATQERGQAMAAAGIALDVVGGLAIVGGGIWTGVWLNQRKGREGVARASLRPAGLGLVLDGTF